MAKRFTKEQEEVLNSWARTASELRRAFPYTTGSQTETRGFGYHLNKEVDPDGRFYIEVRQSDGLVTNPLTSVLSFNSENFYLEHTTNPNEIMVNLRGSSGGGVTDHGALTGLDPDDDHAQYLLASDAGGRVTFAANWTDLTDGGGTTLHTHDHGALTGLGDDDHPQYARKAASQITFDGVVTAEAFYMSSGGDLSAITRNITLQFPSRRDTITFFSAEADFNVKKMRAILRSDDTGFYPSVKFTLRHGATFPSRGFGTELVTGGWLCGFYSGHPILTADKNPLVVTSFDSDTIQKDDWVTLETLDLGEGNGIEEELAISLWLER